MELKDLIGQSLQSFSIQECTEVYKNDCNSKFYEHVGLFLNPDISEAFRRNQVDANYHSTAKRLVLTNGSIAFEVKLTPMKLYGDEKARLEILEKIKSKLSKEEQQLLGMIS